MIQIHFGDHEFLMAEPHRLLLAMEQHKNFDLDGTTTRPPKKASFHLGYRGKWYKVDPDELADLCEKGGDFIVLPPGRELKERPSETMLYSVKTMEHFFRPHEDFADENEKIYAELFRLRELAKELRRQEREDKNAPE